MSSILNARRIVVGVTGGISAYKTAELVRLLVKAGAHVQVIMTAAAQQFVGPLTFATLSRNPVATDLFTLDQESRMSHIRLADEAELLIVAPATADTIAKFALGLADNLLTTLHLVTRAPVLLAPAMNPRMWEHETTREHVAKLSKSSRIVWVGPEVGELAEGYSGIGRMAEPATILEAAETCLGANDFSGRHVVVAAGPTREPLDAARTLTNRSSGTMGFALARAARARGATVTLIAGPVALPTPWGVTRQDVETAEQMKKAVLQQARAADFVMMPAAVSDYRPTKYTNGKIRKGDVGRTWKLDLVQNDDILAMLGRNKSAARALLVGFAAEPKIDLPSLKKKRADKRCDLLVANPIEEPGVAFDSEENHVWILDAHTCEEVPRLPKIEVAHRILDRAVALTRSKKTTK